MSNKKTEPTIKTLFFENLCILEILYAMPSPLPGYEDPKEVTSLLSTMIFRLHSPRMREVDTASLGKKRIEKS